MASFKIPGPICRFFNERDIDLGTMCRNASPQPGTIGNTAVFDDTPTIGNTPAVVDTPQIGRSSPDPASFKTYQLMVPEIDVFGKAEDGTGKYKNSQGNTECVEFVRQGTNAPETKLWERGAHVKSSGQGEIPKYTAIATFDESGRYPTDSLGRHAAIYLGHSSAGIEVLDQWNSQGEVKKRTIRFGRPGGTTRSNDGDGFYVIQVGS